MKAAYYESTGPAAQVIQVGEVATPDPGPGEVRVRVHYSGVNPTDWKSRAGATPRPIESFQIPNHDGAGVIDAVGEGVEQSRIGQRVWVWFAASGRWGTAAEWTVVPAERAVPLPDGASLELGAMLGVPAMTAHRCLFADGTIRGSKVLVAGGAGAVGHFAIELGKWAGAQVITTVSNQEKANLASQAGADLIVNYREEDAAERIKTFTGEVDRVVEVALGPNLELDLAVTRVDGVIVVYAADGADPVLPVRACMTANVVLRFLLLYRVPDEAHVQAVRDITTALDAGVLTELPVHHFPIEETARAHDAVEKGAVGKVLIDLV